jgi:hypothetical protein
MASDEITDEIIKKTESKKCKEYIFKDGEIQKLVRKAQYQVESVPVSFGCNTDIINGFFTLDNSKYIYLSFIYEFMYKCLDMERIHYAEGDTDSMFLSIAGSLEEDYHQAFKNVILNEKFYNENVYSWLPTNFYSTGDRPKFANKMEEKLFNKSLAGFP